MYICGCVRRWGSPMLVHYDSKLQTFDQNPGGKGCYSRENVDWMRECDTWHIQRQHAPSFGILLSILSEWAACSGVRPFNLCHCQR